MNATEWVLTGSRALIVLGLSVIAGFLLWKLLRRPK